MIVDSEIYNKLNMIQDSVKYKRVSGVVRRKVYLIRHPFCRCCGSTKRLTVDHVVPLKLGGIDKCFNYQTLCYKCNIEKGLAIIDYRKALYVIQPLEVYRGESIMVKLKREKEPL